ncbi:hypothetical protein T01_6808 [Trichinella spiralis]|uniref:Uncharacterized protein n=1 Tax=Trichinella spiralis TaxID=6334 RepID=A0A0V1AVV7_TRISP|nr:hypothetical protein T01_6808 [Trichinella spiralis]
MKLTNQTQTRKISHGQSIELKLCFIKLIANLCSEQSNIRRNTPSPVEIHSPPHRLSTTPEDLNYGIYIITRYNQRILPHQKIMNV